MATLTNLGSAPRHDPIYGIDRANIAKTIHKWNWRSKAVCRLDSEGTLYVFVRKGKQTRDGEDITFFCVEVHRIDGRGQNWNTKLGTLKEAIAYANGRDDSEFAKRTRSASPSEYPRSREADTYFSGFSNGGVPDWTHRLPGRFTD